MKQKSVAYLLCILPMFLFLGGIHRLYLGKIGTGILQLLTCGGFFIWQFIDLFLIPQMVDEVNLAAPITALARPQVNQQQQTQQQVIINISRETLNAASEPKDAE